MPEEFFLTRKHISVKVGQRVRLIPKPSPGEHQSTPIEGIFSGVEKRGNYYHAFVDGDRASFRLDAIDKVEFL